MKRWFKAIAAGAATLAPVAALAAIDTTHHDMTAPGYNVSTQKCAYCHSISLGSANTSVRFNQVGTFCLVVCHDGTAGIANARPASPGYFDAAFVRQGAALDPSILSFDASHGSSPVTLASLPEAVDAAADVAATGWPHTSATVDMECTSCHAVHDGANPPFLNGPLSNRTTNAGSFCQRCHTGSARGTKAGRFEDITAMGAHPTEFVYATAPVRTAPKLGREMLIKSAALWTNTGQTTIAAFNAPGPDWDLGGKFINATGDGLPDVATDDASLVGSYFGCYTCHSAHQADVTNTGSSYLLMANQNLNGVSVLCTGCHGLAASTENPGTTANYHPANAQAAAPYQHDHTFHGASADANVPSTGLFPIPVRGDTTGVALEALASMRNGAVLRYLGTATTGGNNNVLCISCHDVHGGVAGQMAIRNIDNAVQITNADSVCLSCHVASTDNNGLAANWHHPGAAATNYNTTAGFPTQAAWTTGDALGSMTDGLSCPDCHTFQGSATRRATAHNW